MSRHAKFSLSFILLTFLLVIPHTAHAEQQVNTQKTKKSHAMAMRGKPRYGETFTHFDGYNPDAPKTGEAKLAVIKNGFDTLNPFLVGAICAEGMGKYHYLPYDTLMEKCPFEPYTLYGRLAQYVELADDRSWVIFHINPKARFADESPVMASDVKFTFETLAAEGGPTHQTYASKIKDMEILSPHTLKITFNPLPNGNYDREAPFVLAQRIVLSEKDIHENGFKDRGMKPLLGSGPYAVEAVKEGRSITFKRRANYWGANLPSVRGLYNFDVLTYEYFASSTVAFEAFKAGDVHHWSEADPQLWHNNYTFPAVKEGKVKTQVVSFNDAAVVAFLVYNSKRAPLNNANVRKALGLLFDFDWVNKNLFYGSLQRSASHYADTPFRANDIITNEEEEALKRLTSPLPQNVATPLEPLYHSEGQGMRSAIRKSHALLKKAGWSYKNGLMRNIKTGKLLVFTLILNGNRFDKIVLPYKRLLQKAGITLRVQVVDSAQHQERVLKRDYDMMITFYGTGTSPGVEQKLYYGSYFADVPSRNHAGVALKVVDELCDLIIASRTVEDQALFTRLLDRVLRTQHFMTPLFYRGTECVAFWSHMHHPQLTSIFVPSIYAWWAESAT